MEVPVGKLREQMEARMRLANYSPRSIACYTRCVYDLARHYRRSPDGLTAEEVRAFLLHRREVDGVSLSTQRVYTFAFRYFYGAFLEQEGFAKSLPVPRAHQKLPDVPTRDEVRRLLEVASSVRDRAFLSLAYGTGMRVSELVALEVQHIDSAAGLIRVVKGKGGKDRVVPLSPAVLRTLRSYWAEVRPARPWLFAGQGGTRHLAISTGQGIIRRTAKRAELTPGCAGRSARRRRRAHRRSRCRATGGGSERPERPGKAPWISTHSLRHAFATHMIEDGVDVRLVQQILGHANLLTTARYLRVCEERMRHAESPLDRLSKSS